MTAPPTTAKYRWTPKDFQDFAAGRTPLTPYGIQRRDLIGKAPQPGQLVDVPLGQYAAQSTVSRFDVGDGMAWEPLPEPMPNAKTLADLLKALRATNNPKYAARYYDVDAMSPADRRHLARLLFDHWDNTNYRYGLITGGEFNWVYLDDQHDSLSLLKVQGKDFQDPDTKSSVSAMLRVIPVARAGASSSKVAPGGAPQAVTVPDPALALLDQDIRELVNLARQIATYMEKSREGIVQRAQLARSFTALRTMLGVCVAGSNSSANTQSMWQTATQIEQQASESLTKIKAQETLDHSTGVTYLDAALRQHFGLVEDMAEAIKVRSESICTKLTEDSGFAGRCATFMRTAFEKKLVGTVPLTSKMGKLIEAVVEALAMVQDAGPPDAFRVKLGEILNRASDAPALKASDVKKETALDAILSVLGTVQAQSAFLQVANATVGNLAGPPSLWIAVVQTYGWFELRWRVRQAKAWGSQRLKDLLEDVLKKMERGIAPTKAVRAQLRDCVTRGDQAGLLKIKRDVLDEWTGQRQASAGWKVGMVGIQVLALLAALASAKEDNGEVFIADVVNIVGQVMSMGVGIADASLTLLQTGTGKALVQHAVMKLPTLKVVQALIDCETSVQRLALVGMRVGMFAAFLGIIAGCLQYKDAKRQGDAIGQVSAALSIGGNVLIVIACGAWLAKVPMPYVQGLGLALVIAGTVIPIARMAYNAMTPGPNRIAEAILQTIRDNPFHDVLWAKNEGNYQDRFKALVAGCHYELTKPETALPLARNNMFVIQQLRDGGFLDEHITLICEKVGAPLTPTGAVPAMGR
jgi:hypothetical protein